MSRLVAALVASTLLACGTRHTVKAPTGPDPRAPIEIGPILDENGVDVGPMVAERLRNRELADAHVTATPSGSSTYVEGRVRATEADRGTSGSIWGGILSLSPGIMGCTLGGTFLALGNNESSGGSDLRTPGAVLLVGGLGLSALAIWFFTRPSRYMEARITADLDVRRGGTSRPLRVDDNAKVRHGVDEPEVGGLRLLDGVVNSIGSEAQSR